LENIMKKIIIVDDVNYHLLSVKERLKHRYEIFPAQSAEILFEVLGKVAPDLILLDIQMPDVDGYQVIEKLKGDNKYREIPVVFFTGKNDKKSALKGMALGAADYLTKPVDTDKLIDCIENQLNLARKNAITPIILAVDDSPLILQSINQALRNKYTVYTVPRPELVMEVLKKVTPDLFILDLQMPRVTGFELIPIIRSSALNKDTPIIFMTTEATNDNIMIAIHHHKVADFIVKPVDEKILREKVALHLGDFMIRRSIRNLEDKNK